MLPFPQNKASSLVAQTVKSPPAMPETWVRSLGREDLLEKGKAAHASILARRIPWWAAGHGVVKSQQPWGCEKQLTLSLFTTQSRPPAALEYTPGKGSGVKVTVFL